MNECVFIYRTYHIVSQGGLQFYLSEIGRQLVKPSLVNLFHIGPDCSTNTFMELNHAPLFQTQSLELGFHILTRSR